MNFVSFRGGPRKKNPKINIALIHVLYYKYMTRSSYFLVNRCVVINHSKILFTSKNFKKIILCLCV